MTGSDLEVDYAVAITGFGSTGIYFINENVIGLCFDLVVVGG